MLASRDALWRRGAAATVVRSPPRGRRRGSVRAREPAFLGAAHAIGRAGAESHECRREQQRESKGPSNEESDRVAPSLLWSIRTKTPGRSGSNEASKPRSETEISTVGSARGCRAIVDGSSSAQCHQDWLICVWATIRVKGAIPRGVRVRAGVTPLDVVSEADGLTSPHSSPNSRARSTAADLDDTPNFA